MGKTFVPTSSCAPYSKHDEISCFSTEELEKIRVKVNSKGGDAIPSGLPRAKLWREISQKMSPQCKSEFCWSRKMSIGKDKFRPELPEEWKKKPTTWLSNFDIDAVMKQYEKAYPDFLYLGTVPIDFDKKMGMGQCVSNTHCQLSLESAKHQRKTKIGTIFNLDKHDQPGSHWVAMYYDIEAGDIFYWDSYGIEPPQEVKEFMDRLSKQARKLKCNEHCVEPRLYFNDIRHQRKNSECGMYSIYFITELLAGRDFKDVIQTIMPDDKINSYRKRYFSMGGGGRRRNTRRKQHRSHQTHKKSRRVRAILRGFASGR